MDLPDSPTLLAYRRLLALVPPVRFTLIALVILGAYGVDHFASLGGGLEGLPSLIVLPLVAAMTDLAFQGARFAQRRVPESAIVTGLFLALIFPPTVGLVAAGATAFGAVALRHILRFRGRPLFNPAVTGLLLGGALFGLSPAWWMAVTPLEEVLVLALGILLVLRNFGSWRLPTVFFAAYAGLVILQHAVVGTTLSPTLLFLSAVDPAVVFFGFFMVTEPRTAPRDTAAKPLYAGVVAVSAVFLALVVPNVAELLGLLVANGVSVVLRYRRIGRDAPASNAPGSAAPVQSERATSRTPARWSAGSRAVSLVIVLILLGLVTSALYAPSASNPFTSGSSSHGGGSLGGSSSGNTWTNCQTDNPSIPASTLNQLHNQLGPSVILSYDPNSAVSIFYDPVNHVTVTETDMFEDYGFAEFNGDDSAVNGCSP